MKQITREWLAFLREQYPVGSRIRLNSMEDPYAPVEPGTMGTLQRIDDAGQFLMKWDNGRTLSLIPGEDSFSLILPEPTMMKLYMPLHADLYTKDDWSDTSEEPEMLTGRALMEYEDSILIALIKNRMSEEAERGIMRWYAANNYDGQAFAPKAQYYRHADGRDDGLKKIDPDSAEAFADWLENREKGGHPWEVCRGGNSTHVSLYVGLGRVAEGCYHLALAAKSYGRCVEAIKFYLALKHAGLPVIIYGAEFIKKRLLGLERVGIVPNEVMPFYCHSRFPGEDVDSFRHLNHENPDAEIALIEWQPIKPVKLKENAHE